MNSLIFPNYFNTLLRLKFVKFKVKNYSKLSLDNTVDIHGFNLIDNVLPGTSNPQYTNCNNYKLKLTLEYYNVFKRILNLPETEIENSNISINNLWKSDGFCKTFLPIEFNGYGSNYTNFAYLIENLKSNLSFSTLMIVNNLLCAQAIIKYGNSSLKSKYLAQIASGEYIGSFCLHETYCGNNIYMMESTGEYCHETKLLKVSARKQWIYNAESMEFCILFLKTRDNNGTEGLSAFFVDKSINSTKIETYPTKNLLNIPNVYNVIFDNVTIEAELLGNIGDGFKIAVDLQNSARFSVASALLGISKEALYTLSSNNDLSSSYINNKIVDWTAKVFGVETLLYFSTNVADNFPDSHFAIEFASLKIRASEIAFEIINGCLEISQKYQKNLDFYMNLLNKIRGLDLFLGSSDVLRLYIGGVSLQKLTDQLELDIESARKSNRSIICENGVKVIKASREVLKVTKSDMHKKTLDLLKDSIKSNIIIRASRSIYNLPNEDIFISGLGNAIAILYNLEVAFSRFKTISNDKLTDEQIRIIKKCIDDLKYKLLGAVGMDGNFLYHDFLNVQYNDLSQIVFNNKIHGIEHAITRNW